MSSLKWQAKKKSGPILREHTLSAMAIDNINYSITKLTNHKYIKKKSHEISKTLIVK
jgi:hypothetical protein